MVLGTSIVHGDVLVFLLCVFWTLDFNFVLLDPSECEELKAAFKNSVYFQRRREMT